MLVWLVRFNAIEKAALASGLVENPSELTA